MDIEAIREKITPIFRDVLDRDDLILRDDLSADQVEEWDSLSHTRLVVAIEKAFQIRFTNAEIAALGNVGEFVKLIATKLAMK